mmetsp:Transcript_11368/g.20648  ORF Transcript_11368/g.20648 Transcript_11368/m.20648 type:complete len:132 (-) Transcript_11368:1339-1734(-)
MDSFIAQTPLLVVGVAICDSRICIRFESRMARLDSFASHTYESVYAMLRHELCDIILSTTTKVPQSPRAFASSRGSVGVVRIIKESFSTCICSCLQYHLKYHSVRHIVFKRGVFHLPPRESGVLEMSLTPH